MAFTKYQRAERFEPVEDPRDVEERFVSSLRLADLGKGSVSSRGAWLPKPEELAELREDFDQACG